MGPSWPLTPRNTTSAENYSTLAGDLAVSPVRLGGAASSPCQAAQVRRARAQERQSGGLWYHSAVKGEGRVERGCRCTSHDVRTHTQPVGIESRVARPCLQIRGKRRGPGSADWSRGREPVELSTVGECHLRDEEVVIGRKIERDRERDVELNFLTGQGAVAA